MKGLSVRNLKYMRAFAEAYPEFLTKESFVQQPDAQIQNIDNQLYEKVQQPVAQLPWGHHIILLTKVKTVEERAFYIQKCIVNNWSRTILALQIDNELYARQGKAITNFEHTLPAHDSDLAIETFKNPYLLDFLALSEEAKEKDLERALIQHLKKFMLELGKGFAYVGNQYNLNVDGDDFFLDLLFFNTHLDCFVVFELKVGEFKPEYAGKLNFYINTVNEKIKGKNHKPTIGVLLCKTPNETVIKYSLTNIEQPIGVADYKLAKALPKNLKLEMPTMEELEKELEEEAVRLEKPVDTKMKYLKELLKGLKEEEVKEKKSDAKTLEVFHKVLIRMKKEISEELNKEISPLFNSFRSSIRTGNYGNSSIDAALEHLTKHPNEFDLGLEFRFHGFKSAGVNAFNCSVEIRVYLHEYKYTITKDRNLQKPLFEKLYHQLPGDEEFNLAKDAVKEEVLDEITRQVERIKQQDSIK
jgi:predicted nuclease of restriction endonuclease-like (RecB) superfamily